MNNVKNNIKSYWITLLLIAFIFIDLFVTLPYQVYTPGGTISVCNRLDNNPNECGDIYSTYVKVLDGKITNVLLGLIIHSWDVKSTEDIKFDTESVEDALNREKIELYKSISSSTYVAYQNANVPLKIKAKHLYISYKTPESKNDLKVGDEIIKIDGVLVDDADKVKDIITKTKKDKLTITVLRHAEEIDIETSLYLVDNVKTVGIATTNTYEFEDAIKYSYESNESGSSGGLMMSLALYNSLTVDNITNGKKVCGTGTIDYDGTVDEIGGIKYKLAGAVKDKCDIFITPTLNYEEAKKVKEDNDYQIELIEAKTFNQVIDALKKS